MRLTIDEYVLDTRTHYFQHIMQLKQKYDVMENKKTHVAWHVYKKVNFESVWIASLYYAFYKDTIIFVECVKGKGAKQHNIKVDEYKREKSFFKGWIVDEV